VGNPGEERIIRSFQFKMENRVRGKLGSGEKFTTTVFVKSVSEVWKACEGNERMTVPCPFLSSRLWSVCL